jgi:hypothetical protein
MGVEAIEVPSSVSGPSNVVRQSWLAIRRIIGAHRAMAAVCGAFLVTVFIVPVRTNVAIVDDWVYIREAQTFALHLRVHILDQTGATAVFETFWGGLFGIVLGTQLWVFRLSTVVLSFIGGLAMYGVCRELGTSKRLSAIGAALLLFNPLYFVLTYTFMTDAHFVALSVLATYGYLKGLDASAVHGRRWTLVASGFAALAYLSRPQGALIPVGVVVTLALARQLKINRASLGRVVQVALIPLVVFAVHQWWLRAFNGVPPAQEAFAHDLVNMPLRDAASLVTRMTGIEGAYAGLFLLPLGIAILLALRFVISTIRWPGWLLAAVSTAVLLGVAGHFATQGRQMPYVQSSPGMGVWGLGTDSVVGSRPPLFSHRFFDGLTVVAVIGFVIVALVFARAIFDRTLQHRLGAGLVGALLVMMALGAIPPSAHIRDTFDRYLVPLLPFVIALAIWAVQGLRRIPFVMPVSIALMAVVCVVGTRDSLVFEQAVWKMADHANALGIPNTELDAGASRTRYFLANQAPKVALAPGAAQPWWIWTDGATTARYLISVTPFSGYEVIDSAPIDEWVTPHPVRVYLLRLVG